MTRRWGRWIAGAIGIALVTAVSTARNPVFQGADPHAVDSDLVRGVMNGRRVLSVDDGDTCGGCQQSAKAKERGSHG